MDGDVCTREVGEHLITRPDIIADDDDDDDDDDDYGDDDDDDDDDDVCIRDVGERAPNYSAGYNCSLSATPAPTRYQMPKYLISPKYLIPSKYHLISSKYSCLACAICSLPNGDHKIYQIWL